MESIEPKLEGVKLTRRGKGGGVHLEVPFKCGIIFAWNSSSDNFDAKNLRATDLGGGGGGCSKQMRLPPPVVPF